MYSWDTAANELVEVENNKLALRARVEMYGPGSLASDAEGSIVSLYSLSGEYRRKKQGYSGTSSAYIWTRTPYNAQQNYIVYGYNGGSDRSNLTDARGIAPFGCM